MLTKPQYTALYAKPAKILMLVFQIYPQSALTSKMLLLRFLNSKTDYLTLISV